MRDWTLLYFFYLTKKYFKSIKTLEEIDKKMTEIYKKAGKIVKITIKYPCPKCNNHEFYYLGREDIIKGGKKPKKRHKLQCTNCDHQFKRLVGN